MSRDAAAYAANWRTVLAVDGLVGVGVAALGLVLGLRSMPVVGSLLVVAGVGYGGLVVRRYRRWRTLRDDAGLS